MTFTFPSRPNITILKNVSLNIEPNTVTAIVGRSGSGKSTIASLLLRLYEPQSGGILLDGVDIRELNLHWLVFVTWLSPISLFTTYKSKFSYFVLFFSLYQNLIHYKLDSFAVQGYAIIYPPLAKNRCYLVELFGKILCTD